MRHYTSKFEDVGKICLEIFFLSFLTSDIHNPPVSSAVDTQSIDKL